MNKTKIEWVRNPDGSQGFTWNPITGCLNGCPYCYARRLANGRLRDRYLANKLVATARHPYPPFSDQLEDPFAPRFWPGRLEELHNRNRGLFHSAYMPEERGIFVCDMSDLFGNGIPEDWINEVLHAIEMNKLYDRFYLLTKQPQNLIRWSPFPDNCWMGVSVTNKLMLSRATDGLMVVKANIKYISFEPLLEDCSFYPERLKYVGVNWLIIGSLTGTIEDMKESCLVYPDIQPKPYGKRWTLQPKLEWVEEIEEAADKAGIPVFEKDNLMPLLQRPLRQEFPK